MVLKAKVDNNVEALRGYCALMVVLFHCVYFSTKLNNGYNFTKAIIYFMPPGHTMVMVFFMLSGYVIGFTTGKHQTFNIRQYLKRRLVRLYPIYLISILLTIALFKESVSSTIGTLFFAQNLFVNVLEHNGALWSLNYEFLFYLLAIPIIKFDINPKYVLGFLFFMVVAYLKIHYAEMLFAYVIGFIFWMTGYALSKMKLTQVTAAEPFSGKLLSLFFLLLTADILNMAAFVWKAIINKLHIQYLQPINELVGSVNIRDFGLYLLCVYAICIAAVIKSKWIKPLTLTVFISAWAPLLYFIYQGSFFKSDMFYIPAVCLVVSTVFYFIKKTFTYSVSFWANVGGISYALYVIHAPVLFGIGSISSFSGDTIFYVIRVIVVVVVAVLIAYLLERKLQPHIKQYFSVKSVH